MLQPSIAFWLKLVNHVPFPLQEKSNSLDPSEMHILCFCYLCNFSLVQNASNEWYIKLSYGPRWVTYIFGIGKLLSRY